MRKKLLKRLFAGLLSLFVIMNTIAAFHAYKFTHFAPPGTVRTEKPAELSFLQKLQTLAIGVSLPRPQAKKTPGIPFDHIKIKGEKLLDCWYFKSGNNTKGVVAMFHGYGGEKSSQLDKASILISLGYDVLLVDFRGSGVSEGKEITIGYKEAGDVKAVVNYLNDSGKDIILLGTSMGAAAVMKALAENSLAVRAAIIECPFGTMRRTVKSRFRQMGVPSFPLVDLLVFWGGVENGFNAFKHNPEDYASKIKCPVLLLWGGKDEYVTKEETVAIYNNLTGSKKLVIYPEAAHESYLNKYASTWTGDISGFLAQY